jgi:transcriptional regulator with XRE-family HTH domain
VLFGMPPPRTDPSDFHFVDAHVGARLRLRREQLGVSQKRLAEAAGVSHQQIQKYESAVNRISMSCLCACARFLNIPVLYFFDGLPPTTTKSIAFAVPEHELQSRETAHLVAAWFRIAPGRRRAVFRLIRSMTEGCPATQSRPRVRPLPELIRALK